MTLSREFIVVFIRYFIEVILSKKSCQKRCAKKKIKNKKNQIKRGYGYKGDSDLLHTMRLLEKK